MRKGWELKRIVEVCELKGGTTISPKSERTEGEILYAKVADMNLPENQVEINTSSRFADAIDIPKNQIIPIGAIIFPKRGGAIATNKKRKIVRPTIVDLNTMAIIPGNKLDNDFFYYWFQQIDLNSLSNGTSIPQINNYSFNNVYITYPSSITEQKRIVAILNETFDAIAKAKANAERNLRNVKEIFESYLKSVLSNLGKDWEMVPLSTLTELSRGHNPPKNKFSNEEKKGYLRFYQIRDGWSNDYKVYVPDTPQLHRVRPEDILMVAYRHIGKAFRGVSGAFNVALCKISNKRKDLLDDDYLFQIITTSYVKGELLKRSERSLIPSMSIEHLKEIKIPLPNLKNQKLIINNLNKLSCQTEKLEVIYKQKLTNLDDLKKSILQKAFAGELHLSPEKATS